MRDSLAFNSIWLKFQRRFWKSWCPAYLKGFGSSFARGLSWRNGPVALQTTCQKWVTNVPLLQLEEVLAQCIHISDGIPPGTTHPQTCLYSKGSLGVFLNFGGVGQNTILISKTHFRQCHTPQCPPLPSFDTSGWNSSELVNCIPPPPPSPAVGCGWGPKSGWVGPAVPSPVTQKSLQPNLRAVRDITEAAWSLLWGTGLLGSVHVLVGEHGLG